MFRYKSLADICELGFGPVYHCLPKRICAHAAIYCMALILYRVIRMRLKDADAKTSLERALEVLRRIQHHQVRLNEKTSMQGISSIT